MKNTVLEATTLAEKKTELTQMCAHEVNSGKIFVVVEGSDDEIIYKYFINEEKVTFYVAKNYCHIIELLKNLKNNPSFENRLVGIKDADFDHILHRTYPDLDNLFITDYHDIEMTILSASFEDILKAEYKLPHTTVLVEKVKEDLKSLSYLRLYNEVMIVSKNLDGINFQDISYSTLYDGKLAIEMEYCISHIKSKCNNARLTHFPTKSEVDDFSISYADSDLKQLTRGHDFLYALQVRIKKLCDNERWGYKGLGLMLRTNFSIKEFEKTNLYQTLNAWMRIRNLNLWRVA